jgi:carbonic anhydrase/acetyltransferase-like protein (isoleucine patch superfamily)
MPLYAVEGTSPELAPDFGWIAPDAVLVGRVRLKRHASIWWGAVLRGDNDWIEVGENSNVQDLTMIHADPGQPAIIGDCVTIGHRVILHSATVGDFSLVGMGAVLLNGATVGRHCLVGAGALITEGKRFEDGTLILGSPARAARALTAREIEGLKRSAEIYVANAARYRATLKGVG